MLVALRCVRCGKNHHVKKSVLLRKGRGQYCSKACHDAAQSGIVKYVVSKNCEWCRSEFSYRRCRPRKFCSPKCQSQSSKTRVVSESTRIKLRNWNSRRGTRPPSPKGRKLSASHKSKILASRKRWFDKTLGTFRKKHLKDQIRNHPEYKKWRLAVFVRDEFKCKICGSNDRTIQADHFPQSFAGILQSKHIKTIDDALACKLLWKTEHGRTICLKCHEKTPTFMNRWHVRPVATIQSEFDMIDSPKMQVDGVPQEGL